MSEFVEPDWHGWSTSDREDYALHVGRLPGRKRVCLYEHDGGTSRVLAFFKDAESAARALDALDRLAEVPR